MSWGIKLDKADKEWSRYIRLKHKRCERCRKPGGGVDSIKGLECSHYWGRRKESVRYDEFNTDCLCNGCHRYFGENPGEYRDWKFNKLGEVEYNKLMAIAHTPAKRDRDAVYRRAKELIKQLQLEEQS